TEVFWTPPATLGALTTLPNPPSACAFSVNQCNVANAINAFFNNRGALPPAFVNIFGLTGVNLGNALSQLSGEAATGAQQAAFQLTNQFLGVMLDPFVDGRNNIAGAGGPALGFAPEREELPDDIALAYARCSRRRPSRRTSNSAGACGARAMAAATARRAIPRWSAATICPRARRGARPGSIIISRATAWWASRSPAAAPTGGWRRAWAAARATRSRPASTARPDGAPLISPPRSHSPITGCRPIASPLPATTSARASTRSRSAGA